MGAAKKNTIPAEKLELYEKLIRTNPKIERKGATNPYTSLNGHMFTHLEPSGTLSIRLPEGPRDEFIKKYKTTLHKIYGIVQKEWVTVPEALLKDTKELAKYLEISFQYVKAMKPKPGKKKS